MADVGDLALTFGAGAPRRGRLGAPWETLATGPGWRLWTTPSTERWRGHRLLRTPHGGGERFTLGEPGHELSFTWDPGPAGWTVRTDRFATLHAYAGRGIVTTFSPAAWGDQPPLDWLAIAGFVRLGWYPADRMPVAGVRAVRPAREETWSGDGEPGGARRWWSWTHDPEAHWTAAEAAGALGDVLAEVLDEQAAGDRLAVPISGGLDSRQTVAVLTRPGSPVDPDRLWAYSYGYEASSPELRIAGEVASARRLPLARRVIGPYLFDDLDRVADATEGLVDLTLCRQAAVAGELAEHADAVVAAHWGDVWFGAPAPGTGRAPADALLTASTKRGHEWLTEHLVRPHLGADPEPALRELLAAEAELVAGIEDPTVALLALKTEQWSWRWTESTLRAFQMALPPRLPYYDPRVADLVLRLPAPLLADRRLQIEHLRTHAPDLARVEWQAAEADLFALRHQRTWRLPRRAARRLWRRLRPPAARLRNWETQLLEPAGQAGVDRWLREPGARVHDLVPRAEVEALVGRHRAAPTDPGLGYAVSALLTFAVWLERAT